MERLFGSGKIWVWIGGQLQGKEIIQRQKNGRTLSPPSIDLQAFANYFKSYSVIGDDKEHNGLLLGLAHQL